MVKKIKKCDSCKDPVPLKTLTEIGTEKWCDRCVQDYTYACENCDALLPNDSHDLVLDREGTWLCRSCADALVEEAKRGSNGK